MHIFLTILMSCLVLGGLSCDSKEEMPLDSEFQIYSPDEHIRIRGNRVEIGIMPRTFEEPVAIALDDVTDRPEFKMPQPNRKPLNAAHMITKFAENDEFIAEELRKPFKVTFFEEGEIDVKSILESSNITEKTCKQYLQNYLLS